MDPCPLTWPSPVKRGEPVGFQSEVAGNAEILVVPDLEAGRILIQQLQRLIDASAAGIILGYQVPIILPGPDDNIRTCEAACALAAQWVHFHEEERVRKKIPHVKRKPLA